MCKISRRSFFEYSRPQENILVFANILANEVPVTTKPLSENPKLLEEQYSFQELLQESKGERSAKNFRKSQIRKFADLNNLLHLRTFRKCDTLHPCDLRTQSFLWFADLKLPQVRKYIGFSLQIPYNA